MASNRYRRNGRRSGGGKPSAHAFLARHGGDIEAAAGAYMAALNEWAAARTDAEIDRHNKPDVVDRRADLPDPDLEQQALALFRPYIIANTRRFK